MSQEPAPRARGGRPRARSLAILAGVAVLVAIVVAVVVPLVSSDDDSEQESARNTSVTEGLLTEDPEGSSSAGDEPGADEPGADEPGAESPEDDSRDEPASSPSAEPTALAPTPGTRVETVRAELDEEVRLDTSVDVRISKVEAVDGKARGVGEVDGPALRFTVELENGSSSAVSSELGLITVEYGPDKEPAGTLSGPGARMFPAEIAPGDSGTGVFVFNVPPSRRNQLQVTFTYAADAPRVVFSGSAAG